MSTFDKQVTLFVNKAKDEALRRYRYIALTMFDRIIARTPVLTGRLRGNWQTAKNAVPSGELDRKDSGAVNQGGLVLGGHAHDEAVSVTRDVDLDETIWFVNNLPYAQRIEYDRHSKVQAPNGMVRITIKEFKKVVEQSGARV